MTNTYRTPKEEIKYIIECNVRNYSRMIKTRPHLWQEIEKLNLPESMDTKEKIYTYLNPGLNLICPNGNKYKFDDINVGYFNACGSSNVCKCKRDRVAQAVSKTKLNFDTNVRDEIYGRVSDTWRKKESERFEKLKEEFESMTAAEQLVSNGMNNVDVGDDIAVYTYGNRLWIQATKVIQTNGSSQLAEYVWTRHNRKNSKLQEAYKYYSVNGLPIKQFAESGRLRNVSKIKDRIDNQLIILFKDLL